MKVRSHILRSSVARGIAILCAAIVVTSAPTAQAGINVWTSHGPGGGNGELAVFDYDNPLMDPLAGTVLNNTLTLNGVEVPHGRSITPASANLAEDRE